MPIPPIVPCLTVLAALSLSSLCPVPACRAAEEEGGEKSRSIFALPTAYYTSDTGFGYGAAGICTYSSAPGRTSQVLFALSNTTKHQFQATLKGDHYLPGGKYRVLGEIQYSLFPTDFFGLGNATANDDPETYTPEYTMAELSIERIVYRDLRFRAGTFFRNQALVKRDDVSAVRSPATPWGTGRLDSGISGGVLWDSRDNTTSASRGSLVMLEYVRSLHQDRGSGFSGLTLDIRTFFSPRRNWVLGSMIRTDSIRGDYPFYFLPALGGQDRLRGYESFRFMDRNDIVFQQDLRFPVWWRIGGCVFASAGRVARDERDLLSGKYHAGYGAGLRYHIDRATGSILRCDFAFSDDAGGTYITFGEAF